MIDDGEPRGSAKHIGEIDICCSAVAKVEVVFVQPRRDPADDGTGFRHIYFNEFANSIQACGELGCLIAAYLRRWEEAPAFGKA